MPMQLPNRSSQTDNVIIGVGTDRLSVRNAEHGETRPSRDQEFVSDSDVAHPDRNG